MTFGALYGIIQMSEIKTINAVISEKKERERVLYIMHILVFGASGGTGQQVVKQAIERFGYTVTAFARNPDNFPLEHEKLHVVKGDILDKESVKAAVKGKDAVLSTLGVNELQKNTILSDGTQNIVEAMQEDGVKRFICETTMGLGETRQQIGLFWNLVLIPFVLGNVMEDKERQEQKIMDSSIEWVIVRPSGLTDQPLTENYKAGFGPRERNLKMRISRADVADFMLKQLENNEYLHQAVSLSY
jgi:putative NADH-flavin reductase